MVNIQSPTAEIRRRKKEERRRRRRINSMKIYMVSLFHRATINQLLGAYSDLRIRGNGDRQIQIGLLT